MKLPMNFLIFRPLLILGAGLMAASPVHAQFNIPGVKLPSIPGVSLPGSPADIPGIETLFKEEEPITTNIKDACGEFAFLDGYTPRRCQPLSSLGSGPNGGWRLRPGLYSGDIRSYCLHAGTYGPTHGNGYLYAPLKGKRSGMIQRLLHNTASHPELPQSDVQALIWAIEARAKFSELPDTLQKTASALLSPQDILDLNGASVGFLSDQVKDQAFSRVSDSLRPIYEAQNSLRGLLSQADAPFAQMEQVAVLTGNPPKTKDSREIPEGRWTLHPGGFFVRYLPFSYQRTTLQLYVPERFAVKRDPRGRIVSVLDPRGNGVETDYRDTVPALTTSDKNVSGCRFASIRLIRADPGAVGGRRIREYKNVGWTLIGTNTGGSLRTDLNDDYPGCDARFRAGSERWREMDDFRRRCGHHTGVWSDPALFLTLAEYEEGLRDAFGDTDPDSAADALDTLTNACQSVLIWWEYPLPEGPGTLPADSTEYDPSGDVATPGDTGRQRLGQSRLPCEGS